MTHRKLLSAEERQRRLGVPDNETSLIRHDTLSPQDRLEAEVSSEADELAAFRHRSWSQGIALIPDLHGPARRHPPGDSCPRRTFAVLARSRGPIGRVAGHGPGRL